MEAQAHNSLEPPHGSNSPFLKGGLTLPKIHRKGEMEKLLEGRGNPKKGGFWKNPFCFWNAVSLGIFSS